MASKAASLKSRVRRLGAELRRVRARCLSEAKKAREELQSRRRKLVEEAGSLSWRRNQKETRAICRVVDLTMTEGALGSFVRALEDGQCVTFVANGCRIRALNALAEQAGKSARAHIKEELTRIARRHPEMEDALAWVFASHASKGRLKARFAHAAVTAAGRSEAVGPLVTALDVASEPAGTNITRMVVAHIAHLLAGIALNSGPLDSSAVPTWCEGLTVEGARTLARALLATPAVTDEHAVGVFRTQACARLLARAAALLPADEARIVAAHVVSLGVDAGISMDSQEREAVIAHLDGAALETALGDRWLWSAGSLAVRLAELGRVDNARALLEETGGGWYLAVAALRAAAFLPELLGELARASMAALEAPMRGRICGEHPHAAVRVMGPHEVLRFADESGDETGQYVRIVALARICKALPEPDRSEAAARAVRAYREDPDIDALCELIHCARWMPLSEAAWLLFDSLGRHDTVRSFEDALTGYCGIGPLSPLIARTAGDAGLLVTAQAIVAAEGWDG